MISRLTFTSSLPKGTLSDQLSFGARPAKRASSRSQATKPRSACGVAGQEQVDAFLGQQHRALESGLGRPGVEALAQRRRVGQRHEAVGGDVRGSVFTPRNSTERRAS